MSETIRVVGGRVLSGDVIIQGSKNAFHKILAACVRWPGVFRLTGVPDIQDANWLLEQFEHVGGIVTKQGTVIIFDSRSVVSNVIPAGLAERSSGTILFAGALLARFGHVEIAPPGGDKIGYRPVDYHLKAFEALGVQISKNDTGRYVMYAPRLQATEFSFPGKTVNGTINAILAATGAKEKSVLTGCVIESDIENAIEFMNQLDMQIVITDRERGIIEVTPKEAKEELDFTIIADRNATATYAIIAALTGGNIRLTNAHLVDTVPLWEFLKKVGTAIEIDESRHTVSISRMIGSALSEVVEGKIPPAFSTDWGPLVEVLLTQLPGTTEYHDQVFSNRFALVPELVKMGARATLHEVEQDQWVDPATFDQAHKYDRVRFQNSILHGADVEANDIRNGAALVLAGLVAEGETVIRKAFHIKRGYEDMAQTLSSLGAEISWEG